MATTPVALTLSLTLLCCGGLTGREAAAATPPANDRVVFAFGDNGRGQAGLNTPSGARVATPIDTTHLTGKTITQVAAGYNHSLLLANDGAVFSFGWNNGGLTGLGFDDYWSETPIATPIDTTNLAGKTISQVAVGLRYSLLLAEDGTVFSFGMGLYGETGLNATGFTLTATPIDTTNLAGKTITQVAAGGEHSLLLADDGTVFSCGDNYAGQTGLNTTSGKTLTATPIDTTNLAGKAITQVAAGRYHSLLLADDGTVFSFGDNGVGQTGLNNGTGRTPIATPIDTTNLAGKMIAQVAAGGFHSLLLADDGTVFSFGEGDRGQTGLNVTSANTFIATPIDTANLAGKTITKVAAGAAHSLLLADDGTVFSFGFNANGRTGLGFSNIAATSIATPIDTTHLTGPHARVIDISAGGFHSLLLAVPEPTTASLLLPAAALPLLLRRRRSGWA